MFLKPEYPAENDSHFFRLNARRPLLAVPDFCHDILIEFRFVADQKDAALVFLQGVLQFSLGINVQMVCRLVEQENICFGIHDLAQTYLCLLTTGEYPHLALNMLCRQPAFCKCGTYLVLCP